MAEKKTEGTKKIAAVRVRGRVHVRGTIADTLEMLSLRRPNHMTVLSDTLVYRGMIKKAKDYLTWGEIEPALFESIVEKWGRKAGDKRLAKAEAKEFSKKFLAGETTFKEAGIKPCFRLHPPSIGWDRGGVKKHVSVGGAQGNRGKEINVLLAEMAGLKEKKKDGAKE
jgi:large subunit ribosomal protein L30